MVLRSVLSLLLPGVLSLFLLVTTKTGVVPVVFAIVGAPRFELGTSALSGLRSNQLSYAPGNFRV